tara:strand:+ start:294 stop:671 length:378 start_codon:yes stop_codon:yes gene_type:complete
MKVACGLMYDDAGNILVGLRSKKSSNPGYWEFPGGKVESNETIEECLHREWKEELNLEIEIKEQIGHTTSGFVECFFYVGKIKNPGNLHVNVHEYVGFYDPKDILNLRLFDGDANIVKKLITKID